MPEAKLDMHIGRRCWTLALVLGILAACGACRDAAAANVRMTVLLGYGGYVVPGNWAPLYIEVEGAIGDATVEIWRQDQGADGQCVESYPCSSQGGVTKFECPVFVDVLGGRLRIYLRAGGQVLAAQTIRTHERIFPGNLILAVDLPASAQQAIERALLPQEPVRVIPVSLDDLPRFGLSYDGISGLVLATQEPALNPIQVRALRSWLAGGGHLAVCAPRQALGGLAALFGAGVPAAVGREQTHTIGRGQVILVSQAAESIPWLGRPERWRALLSLTSFGRRPRLSPSQCFPDVTQKLPGLASFARPLTLMLLVWALIALMTGLASPRRRVVLLLLCTAAASVAAWPLGLRLNRLWQRGVKSHAQAVILPDGGGILTHSSLAMQKYTLLAGSSRWGARLNLGRAAMGEIRPAAEKPSMWRHLQQAPPEYGLRSGGASRLDFIGLLPAVPVRVGMSGGEPYLAGGPLTASTHLAYWNGRTWHQLQPGADGSGLHWQALKTYPAWLEADIGWLEGLWPLWPQRLWLVGRCSLPAWDLTVVGERKTVTCWAMPISEALAP